MTESRRCHALITTKLCVRPFVECVTHSRARSRALLRLPISRDRRSQTLRPVLSYEYIIFDANAAAAEAVIDPMPVHALSILSASFRVVEDGRNEIQARLDCCDVAGSKR